MSVRLNVSLFVADTSRLPPRSEVISALFTASEPWLTRPNEVLLHNLAPQEQEQQVAQWEDAANPPALVDAALEEKQLLFVYSDRYTSCVSVEEDTQRGQAVYVVSISMPAQEQTDDVKRWVLRLYGVMAAWSNECLLAVRDEAGLTCGKAAIETLEEALGPLNAGWVIAPERLVQALPERPEAELLEAVGGGAVLIRRYAPLL